MIPYWVTFTDRSPGCIEAAGRAEALEKGMAFGNAIEAKILPYPANPRLGETSCCPSFCFQPSGCAGRSCCPRNISCVD